MSLTDKDSYFLSDDKSPDGRFVGFKKYQTLLPLETLTPCLVKAIEQRDVQHAAAFEKAVVDLIEALHATPSLLVDFLQIMDGVRAEGVLQMMQRRAAHLEYHTAEHAEELAFDVEQELLSYFKHNHPEDVTAAIFFIALTKAAATWHDVVQAYSPPRNEIESAHCFQLEMKKEIARFVEWHPNLHNIMGAFIQQLDFIANELIVYSTWLVMAKNHENGFITQAFRRYIDWVARDLDLDAYLQGHYIKLLFSCADTISQCDTSRFCTRHVVKDQDLMRALSHFNANKSRVIFDFFQQASINSDEDRETFLGLQSQDMRMFTELNIPFENAMLATNGVPKNAADISVEDYEHFINVFDANREGLVASDKVDYAHLLDLFINTRTMVAGGGLGKRNIEREQAFALSIKNTCWHDHATNLKIFDDYVQHLDEAARQSLGEILFALATRFQPGLFLLKKDTTLQARIKSKNAII